MISSQLQSQLFSKIATWDILCDRQLVWGHYAIPKELKIEVWAQCVYVHLPKDESRATTQEGISIFLSMWDYLDWFMLRSAAKSLKCRAFQVRKNIYTVTSFQGQTAEPYTVVLRMWDALCNCMLFRCLGKRIANECPYFHQLMKESVFFAGQPVCHHITAALEKGGWGSLDKYLKHQRRRR